MLVGSVSERRGRSPGLTVGYLAGAAIVLAAVPDSWPMLLVSLLVYGSGTAT